MKMPTMYHYILNSEKEVVSLPWSETLTWGQWMEEARAKGLRVVGQDRVGRYLVSTVFLGVDHRFIGGGPPLVFETMVFDHHWFKMVCHRLMKKLPFPSFEMDLSQPMPWKKRLHSRLYFMLGSAYSELEMERYSTWAEAKDGHNRMILQMLPRAYPWTHEIRRKLGLKMVKEVEF